MIRIKTLAEITEQCERITEYLDAQGRIELSHKVQQLYDNILGRVLDSLEINEYDDATLEWVCNEPLIVGVSY